MNGGEVIGAKLRWLELYHRLTHIWARGDCSVVNVDGNDHAPVRELLLVPNGQQAQRGHRGLKEGGVGDLFFIACGIKIPQSRGNHETPTGTRRERSGFCELRQHGIGRRNIDAGFSH